MGARKSTAGLLRAALTAGTCWAAAAGAADHYFLVGGGANPQSSQVSIESNVQWVQQVLDSRSFSAGQTWFASGQGDQPDVRLLQPDNPGATAWEALARVYGQQAVNVNVFRHNAVPDNRGAATAENIEAQLKQMLPQLAAGDSLLLVYSGHGSYEPGHTTDNALRLWNNSGLSVTDLTALLNRTAPGATVRYVLPQCYSGAFARSIFADPAQPGGNVKHGRCGFFSVPENQIAEGCTAAVDIGDYRDYTTYFFAALAGATRTGAPLPVNPDLDGDGRISLHEAHFYAITQGFSTDIPRSTSEFYLETWEPWYARWQSAGPFAADNEFAALATRLARHLQVPGTPGSPDFGKAVLEHRRDYTRRLTAGRAELASLEEAEQKAREKLRSALELHWPNAANAHTAAYAGFITGQLAAADAWLRTQKGYAPLVAQQDRIAGLELTNLKLERQAAQYARLQRALQLARIKGSFDRHASAAQRAQYDTLASCEAWSLPAHRAPAIPAEPAAATDNGTPP